MKIKSIGSYLCALALFSFLIAGCAKDDSGDDAQSTPEFVYVGSEEAAKELVAEAMAVIGELSASFSDAPSLMPAPGALTRGGRAATTEPIDEEKSNNTSLIEGAVVSYTMKGNMTINDDGSTEMQVAMTDTIEFLTTEHEGMAIRGKAQDSSDISMSMTMTLNSGQMEMSSKSDASSKTNYTLSISKAGVGLKYILTADTKAKVDMSLVIDPNNLDPNNIEDAAENSISNITWEKFNVSIKVYDNADVVQIDRSFTDAQGYTDWLGEDAGGLLNLR